MKARLLAIATLLLQGTWLTAQPDRIQVRLAPAPNQTLRMRTVQETNMTMEPGAATAGTPAAPTTTVNIRITLEHTSTVGPVDARGRYQARQVIDTATATMTANGQPAPIQPPMSDVVGQVVTFFYDDQGTLVDVTMGGTLAARAAESVKQLLKSALPTAPPMTLAVGESATTPTQLSTPLPAGTGDMTVTGETTYTLTSVTFEGAERIAHLTMKMTNAMNQRPPAGASGPQVAVDMTMSSEGTTDVNIDRGIVIHTEQLLTTNGTTRFDGSNPAMPAMRSHGTTKISSDVY